MLCPICSVELAMTNRQDVEIDYCPKCRGIWLDRGELDKIIDRVMAQAPGYPHATGGYYDRRDHHDYDDHDHDRDYGRGRRHKHGGFLRELFDF
ncbi:MAG: TFIIB-type zinc ribbon-containing protein [Chloroflexota bacterium]